MQIVIFAGGLGTRLRPLTEATPKSMIMVYGRPFLEYQLDLLEKTRLFSEAILCVGYKYQQVEDYLKECKKYNFKLVFSREKEHLLGLAGALKLAEPLLENTFFTLNGDTYLSVDYNKIFSYFKKRNKKALMVIYKNHNKYQKSNVSISNGYIQRYDKNAQSKDLTYIDAGLSIFKKEILYTIPESQFFSLGEVYARLIRENELLAFETKQKFYDIGSFRDLEEFKKFVGTKNYILNTS